MYLATCACAQGCPEISDKADLVVANSAKIDLEHLYIDLPKYFPYLSEEACIEWNSFKANNPEKLATEDVSWEMPSLLSAAIVSRCHTSTEPKNPISSATLKLLDKEVATPRPVSINCIAS